MRKIRSIEEVVADLREQAALRAPENDVAGVLRDAASQIENEVATLEAFNATAIRSAREALGMTQAAFGAAIGLGRHSIWRYETGGPIPRRSRIAIEALVERMSQQQKKETRE